MRQSNVVGAVNHEMREAVRWIPGRLAVCLLGAARSAGAVGAVGAVGAAWAWRQK